MPIQTVLEQSTQYYLIAFDAEGFERQDDPDGLMSQRVADVLTNEPITDVFILCHGWKGDVPAAKEQYSKWIGTMLGCQAHLQRMQQARPQFRPLYIGLHWPSQPWGDEEFGGSAVSFAPAAAAPLEDLIGDYAKRIADTARARVALSKIFTAAMSDIAPAALPADVVEAYEILDEEAGLLSDGEGAPPGADREPFDPEGSYQAAQEDDAISFGNVGSAGLLLPLRQLSFHKMKDRARMFGESGGHQLLSILQRARADVRFHLIGHSFGCIVVSATLAGAPRHCALVRPADSAVLVQGALSIWSYCADIPPAPGRTGYFHRVVAGQEHKVRGPIITTQSTYDLAVGRFYPLAAGVLGQVVFAPDEFPRYGGLGAFGARGPGLEIVDMNILETYDTYQFESGKIYNLESSRVINEGEGLSGAHSDIAKPEVAHVIWEAARHTG